MGLGGRSTGAVLSAAFRRRNYRGGAEALRRYQAPWSDLRRYVVGSGSYPYRCRIRTPAGVVAPTLNSRHDMLTAHEVFCRRIYPVDPGSAVIVDMGANIGISALYFLTEAPRARCHLFEPNPVMIGRLRENLRDFSQRVVIHEVAVATFEGTVGFGVEESGRYGGIGVPTNETIVVPCRSARSVLEDVVKAEGEIDLLKIDVEGIELELLRSLPITLLECVHAIHVETAFPRNPLPHTFEMRREGLISSLSRPPRRGVSRVARLPVGA
jgi:FkbM family methyltransferase